MNKIIKIQVTEEKIIELCWTNENNFIKYYSTQRLSSFNEIERDTNVAWKYYNNYLGLYKNLGDNAKILDIGCGNSIMDLIASTYNNKAQFYLLDKEEFFTKFVWYDTKHVFYHSWEIVNDIITSSSLNREKINFLNYTDDWPNDLDLITSFWSWGFHYPIINEFGYWDKVLKNLKIGGKLYLDISNNNLEVNPHSIDMISDILGSSPTIWKYENKNRNQPHFIWKNDNFGQGCLWTRNN